MITKELYHINPALSNSNDKCLDFDASRHERTHQHELCDSSPALLRLPMSLPPNGSPVTPSRLLSLPLELLLDIIPMLPYPDALALKHSHPSFYNMVNTSVRLKVSWLLDRKVRGLPTPQQMCCLKSDAEFCNGGLAGGWEKGRRRGKVKPAHGADQVRSIMARRRRHGECKDGRCEVLVGRRCGGRNELDDMKLELFGMRRWGSQGSVRGWWWLMRSYSLVMDYSFWVLVGTTGVLFAFTLKSLWREDSGAL